MQITQSIRERATALVVPNQESTGTVASQAFLAAVERIKPDAEDDPLACWEAPEGTGQSWASTDAKGKPYVGLQLAGSFSVIEHTIDPDSAEARGWELIALAHLARKAG